MNEVKVSVCSYGPGRNLALRYTDPATGRRCAKSAGTRKKKEALKLAGQLERELKDGKYAPACKTLWQDFTWRYADEVLPGLAKKTGNQLGTVFNTVERVLKPKRLADVTAARLSFLASQLRREGKSEDTLRNYLAHLRSAMRWAADVGLLAALPKFPKLHRVKRGKLMKGRAIEPEEFHKMLLAVPDVVGEAAAPSWIAYLRGLWWSGLRLQESLELSWDERDKPCVVLDGKYPVLRIPGDCQKSGRDELHPLAPEFAEMLLAVPEPHRHGKVFRLVGVAEGKGGSQVARVQAVDWVSRMVCRIGKAAGIVVNETTKRDPKTGKTRKVVKYASCHDLRRAFGFRWSRRIMPAELRELMRHADISTTMAFYVGKSADSTAGALWSAYEAESCESGNTLGNIGPNEAESETQETPQAPEKQGLPGSTP